MRSARPSIRTVRPSQGTENDAGREQPARGACFHSLAHAAPSRLDFYRARLVDGLGHVIHERLFAVELTSDVPPALRGPDVLGDLSPTAAPEHLPAVASLPEASSWLNEQALTPFIDEVRTERLAEIDRVAEHVELSLTEVLQRIDDEIGRASDELEHEITGTRGAWLRLKGAMPRCWRAGSGGARSSAAQRAVTLQGVQRLASALILPHPERAKRWTSARCARTLRPR